MSCSQPLSSLARLVCAPEDTNAIGPNHNLCRGVQDVLTVNCEVLQHAPSLEALIARIGLKPNRHGALLYGERGARNMVSQGGMSQHPMQVAPALIRLSQMGLRSYLELGVDSGWTLAIVAAYLKRFGLDVSTGVDLTFERLSSTTRHILKRMHVALVPRNKLVENSIDLCFVDAGHALQDLVNDYHDMQPRCANMMFHDVSDFDCWRNAGGGPARFWAGLKSRVHRERWTEFVSQPDIFPPTFGIGLLFRGPAITLNATALRIVAEPASARGVSRQSGKMCLGGGR